MEPPPPNDRSSAWPEAVAVLVVFLVYVNAPVVAVKFHGLPYILGAAVPLLLGWPLLHYVARRGQKLFVPPALVPLLLLLGVQLIGALAAERPDMAWGTLITNIAEGLVLYLLIANTVRTPAALRRVTWGLVVAGCLMGGLGLYQQVTGTFTNDYGGFAQVPELETDPAVREPAQPRLAGPIGEKNYYAQFLLMLLPLAVCRMNDEAALATRGLALVAALLIVAGVATTFSRGAAVTFVILLAGMVVIGQIKVTHLLPVAVGIVVLLAGLPHFGERLEKMGRLATAIARGGQVRRADTAVQGRLTEMHAALVVFKEHPVVGVGPGMFPHHFRDKATGLGFQVHGTKRHAHCLYLQMAAEAGILGALCFLGVLWRTGYGLLRARQESAQPDVVSIAGALTLSLVAFGVSALFLSFAYVRYFWLIAGLAAAAGQLGREDQFTATREPS